ncbi:unnamed protein product [Strongylus vulgaris]|uniref:Metallo-beta-lactamase domain-containing protein n=1 Tax=Strongylus vulgaris TaxID=40348 RepID=A0A3P7J5U9_STRVU|nr:unnamed protein product [Strongylus vulgaris]
MTKNSSWRMQRVQIKFILIAFEELEISQVWENVIWTPGHTPDSLVLWYGSDKRLFIGDLFYRYGDIMLTYEYTNIKNYEASLRKVIDFVMKQPEPKKVTYFPAEIIRKLEAGNVEIMKKRKLFCCRVTLRYSAAKNDADNECLPTFKHFHHFILTVFAGTHIGYPLRIDEAEGWRFETRDKAMKIILGRDIFILIAFEELEISQVWENVIWTPGHTPDSLVLWYGSDKRLFIGNLFYRYGDIMLTYEYTNIKNYEASLRKVIWTPGHTPDSLVLWYESDKRLFIGDLFYRYGDIMLTYEYTNIKNYEASLRKLRYSAAKNDADNECLPTFKHFHHFILTVFAGTHIGYPLRIDEAEGWRFETRDKAMKIILGRDIVTRLNQAREKAQHYR